MSRTDKDAPWWVRTEYYSPEHAYNCTEYMGNWRVGRQYPLRPCSLPENPIRVDHGFIGVESWRARGCTWEPDWPGPRLRYWCTRGPNRLDRHAEWWGPDRARVRDQMIEAKQQYHGSHEVEIVERVDQHRHAPAAGWWD